MCKFGAQMFNSRLSAFLCTILLFLLFSENKAENLLNAGESEIYCRDIDCQQCYRYSLRDMTGFWYGVEILEHIPNHSSPVESCIKVELQSNDENRVILIWREPNLNITFRFVIADKNKRGVWTSLGNQDVYSPVNDKLSVGNMYEQFKGNVFMLKASGTTAVLTFCSTTKFFTLVLSRSHTANDTELQSVHNLVTRVTGKPIKDVKKYCENNAFQMQPHLLTVLILATGILLINFKKHCKV